MKGARSLSFWILLTLVWLGTVSPAAAVITNPNPALFEDDDGGKLFVPRENVLSAEIFDLGGILGDSEFGFFFNNNRENLFPIFGVTDQRFPDTSELQIARIDFGNGIVWDVDEDELETEFDGSGIIGFYLKVINLPGPNSEFLAFSVPSMNEGGVDLFASFPLKLFPNGYLLAFEAPNVQFPVSFHVAFGIQKAPLPATSFLMLLGLSAFAYVRRNRE